MAEEPANKEKAPQQTTTVSDGQLDRPNQGGLFKGTETAECNDGPKIEKQVSFKTNTESVQLPTGSAVVKSVTTAADNNDQVAQASAEVLPATKPATQSQVLGKRTSEARDGPQADDKDAEDEDQQRRRALKQRRKEQARIINSQNNQKLADDEQSDGNNTPNLNLKEQQQINNINGSQQLDQPADQINLYQDIIQSDTRNNSTHRLCDAQGAPISQQEAATAVVENDPFLSQNQSDRCQIIKQEKNILLVLNELCRQIVTSETPSAGQDQEIDLLSVACRLQECGLSVKQTQRCWELFKKRLKDVQKRESEFVTATRQRISADLCQDQPELLKARLNVYDSHISSLSNNLASSSEKADSMIRESDAKLSGLLTSFDKILLDGVALSQQNGHKQLLETLGKDLEQSRESFELLLKKLNQVQKDDDWDLFTQIKRELDAKYPIKRVSTGAQWSKGELSTLIYGIMRLGEKEFTEIMEQKVFMKRQHDLRQIAAAAKDQNCDFKSANASATQILDKGASSRHTVREVERKWTQLKLMRDLDVDRLNALKDCRKIVTQQDWMLAALMALNIEPQPKSRQKPNDVSLPNQQSSQQNLLKATPDAEKEKVEEETKIESALPTGDSSVPPKSEDIVQIVQQQQQQKDHQLEREQGPNNCSLAPADTVSAGKSGEEEQLFEAIKSLQRPYIVDPLARHDFDTFIVETFKKQRSAQNHKKNPLNSKTSQQYNANPAEAIIDGTSCPSRRHQYNEGHAAAGRNNKSGHNHSNKMSKSTSQMQIGDVEMTETEPERTSNSPSKVGAAPSASISRRHQRERGSKHESSKNHIQASQASRRNQKNRRQSNKEDPEDSDVINTTSGGGLQSQQQQYSSSSRNNKVKDDNKRNGSSGRPKQSNASGGGGQSGKDTSQTSPKHNKREGRQNTEKDQAGALSSSQLCQQSLSQPTVNGGRSSAQTGATSGGTNHHNYHNKIQGANTSQHHHQSQQQQQQLPLSSSQQHHNHHHQKVGNSSSQAAYGGKHQVPVHQPQVDTSGSNGHHHLTQQQQQLAHPSSQQQAALQQTSSSGLNSNPSMIHQQHHHASQHATGTSQNNNQTSNGNNVFVGGPHSSAAAANNGGAYLFNNPAAAAAMSQQQLYGGFGGIHHFGSNQPPFGCQQHGGLTTGMPPGQPGGFGMRPVGPRHHLNARMQMLNNQHGGPGVSSSELHHHSHHSSQQHNNPHGGGFPIRNGPGGGPAYHHGNFGSGFQQQFNHHGHNQFQPGQGPLPPYPTSNQGNRKFLGRQMGTLAGPGGAGMHHGGNSMMRGASGQQHSASAFPAGGGTTAGPYPGAGQLQQPNSASATGQAGAGGPPVLTRPMSMGPTSNSDIQQHPFAMQRNSSMASTSSTGRINYSGRQALFQKHFEKQQRQHQNTNNEMTHASQGSQSQAGAANQGQSSQQQS